MVASSCLWPPHTHTHTLSLSQLAAQPPQQERAGHEQPQAWLQRDLQPQGGNPLLQAQGGQAAQGENPLLQAQGGQAGLQRELHAQGGNPPFQAQGGYQFPVGPPAAAGPHQAPSVDPQPNPGASSALALVLPAAVSREGSEPPPRAAHSLTASRDGDQPAQPPPARDGAASVEGSGSSDEIVASRASPRRTVWVFFFSSFSWMVGFVMLLMRVLSALRTGCTDG